MHSYIKLYDIFQCFPIGLRTLSEPKSQERNIAYLLHAKIVPKVSKTELFNQIKQSYHPIGKRRITNTANNYIRNERSG